MRSKPVVISKATARLSRLSPTIPLLHSLNEPPVRKIVTLSAEGFEKFENLMVFGGESVHP